MRALLSDERYYLCRAMPASEFFYSVDLYRNRARVRVRLLEEQFYSQKPPGLRFEAENLSTRVTSIEPMVGFDGFLSRPKGERFADGIKLVPYHIEFKIDESAQRTLPPSTPVSFIAVNPGAS